MIAGRETQVPISVSRSRVLTILVVSQFAGVSLWFAGNSVMADLILDFGMHERDLGHLTTFVQFGFIAGTLLFSILAVADRFSPSRVFFWSALAAALCSSTLIFSEGDRLMVYGSRFLTGFFLAGIYPVGMKIAADHFASDLGKALGFLVGALVLGTAFPHLVRYLQAGWHWPTVMWTTSGIAIAGGCAVRWWIPDGPYRVKGKPRVKDWFQAFRIKSFRSAAFGYFGHMWELYAFWTFVPLMVWFIFMAKRFPPPLIPLISFVIIAVGGLGCVWGGYLARHRGSRWVARTALVTSGVCCAFSPLILTAPGIWGILLLMIWGMAVVADSPQFSALIANAAPENSKGSALTLVTSIGFAITILSIQLVTLLLPLLDTTHVFWILLPGPVMGVWMIRRKHSD